MNTQRSSLFQLLLQSHRPPEQWDINDLFGQVSLLSSLCIPLKELAANRYINMALVGY